MAVSAAPLAAAPAMTVSPAFAALHTGQAQQFTAVLSGELNGALGTITWRVDGIAGGNAAVGRITSQGLYTAPAAIPAGTTVTVSATGAGIQAATIVAVTSGLTFYVATHGNDNNPGTLAAPWRTIQHAARRAIGGDIVYVRGGVYHEAVNIAGTGSPTAGALVFASYPGEHAVIDGTGVAWPGGQLRGLVNLLNSHSYVVVEGFEIRNFSSSLVDRSPAGIAYVGAGNGVRILNNTIHGITETAGPEGEALGISISGNATAAISNVVVSGNEIYGLKLGRAESLLFDGNVSGFTATGNLIHDNDNIGIDAVGYYGSGPSGYDHARNGEIADNTVYNISTLHNPSYMAYAADGIYCDGCSNVSIERNLIYACDESISASSENPGKFSSYVTIRNNVTYDANMNGISIGGFAGGGGSAYITIVNNTILHNTQIGWGNLLEFGDLMIGIRFENNILDAVVPGALLMNQGSGGISGLTLDHNIYYGNNPHLHWIYGGNTYRSFADYQAATGQDAHSRFADPGLVSVGEPYDLDLAAVSAARAAGNYSLGNSAYGSVDYAGNPRTTGATINVGAYQR